MPAQARYVISTGLRHNPLGFASAKILQKPRAQQADSPFSTDVLACTTLEMLVGLSAWWALQAQVRVLDLAFQHVPRTGVRTCRTSGERGT